MSLIKLRKKYLLSGIDETGRNFPYFLIHLKNPCDTIKEALRQLAGNLTDEEYKLYQEGIIKRQGEYFFIPTELKFKKKDIKEKKNLSRNGNPHIVSEYIKIDGIVCVRGTVRHNEHKMLSLKKVWHQVIKNVQKNSWSAGGRVD